MTPGSSRYPADITCGSFYTTGSGCWTLLSYFHQHFVANTFQAYVLTAICTSLGAKPGFGELYSGRAVDLQLPPHSFHLFSSFLTCFRRFPTHSFSLRIIITSTSACLPLRFVEPGPQASDPRRSSCSARPPSNSMTAPTTSSHALPDARRWRANFAEVRIFFSFSARHMC